MNAKERLRGWRLIKNIRGSLPFYDCLAQLMELRRKLRHVTLGKSLCSRLFPNTNNNSLESDRTPSNTPCLLWTSRSCYVEVGVSQTDSLLGTLIRDRRDYTIGKLRRQQKSKLLYTTRNTIPSGSVLLLMGNAQSRRRSRGNSVSLV